LDGDFEIGLGFWLIKTGALPASVKVASHGGDLSPYHGFLLVLPEHNLTVSVLVNSPSGSMTLGELAERVSALILDDLGRLPIDPPAQPSGDYFAEKANGLYVMPFGYVDLTLKKDKNYSAKTPLVNFSALYQEPNHWLLQYKLFGLIPLSMPGFENMTVRFGEVDDEPVAWLYASNMNLGMMTRPEFPDVDDYWLDRVGTYKAVDNDNAMFSKIKVKWHKQHQILLAGPSLGPGIGMLIPSKPLDDQRLVLQGYGRNLGEVIEWVDEDTLRYSGISYRR
jgi:hypothetical protein